MTDAERAALEDALAMSHAAADVLEKLLTFMHGREPERVELFCRTAMAPEPRHTGRPPKGMARLAEKTARAQRAILLDAVANSLAGARPPSGDRHDTE